MLHESGAAVLLLTVLLLLPLGVPPTPASAMHKALGVRRVLTTTSDAGNATQGPGAQAGAQHVQARWASLLPRPCEGGLSSTLRWGCVLPRPCRGAGPPASQWGFVLPSEARAVFYDVCLGGGGDSEGLFRALTPPCNPPPPSREALEGKGPPRRFQRRLGRRLEEVAKAVGGGYCRLQMPLRRGSCLHEDSGWA